MMVGMSGGVGAWLAARAGPAGRRKSRAPAVIRRPSGGTGPPESCDRPGSPVMPRGGSGFLSAAERPGRAPGATVKSMKENGSTVIWGRGGASGERDDRRGGVGPLRRATGHNPRCGSGRRRPPAGLVRGGEAPRAGRRGGTETAGSGPDLTAAFPAPGASRNRAPRTAIRPLVAPG